MTVHAFLIIIGIGGVDMEENELLARLLAATEKQTQTLEQDIGRILDEHAMQIEKRLDSVAARLDAFP